MRCCMCASLQLQACSYLDCSCWQLCHDPEHAYVRRLAATQSGICSSITSHNIIHSSLICAISDRLHRNAVMSRFNGQPVYNVSNTPVLLLTCT